METETASPADHLLDALREYTDAALALEAFRQANQEVLDILLAHECKVALKETILKKQAREQGPCANSSFAVQVQTKTRRWYDVDYILEHAPYVRDLPGVVVQTVDKAKIETLAKGEMIDSAICQAALRVEQLTPAVTIKRLG